MLRERILRALADPLLVRIAWRMERLREADSVRHARSRATVSPTAVLHPSATIYNHLNDPKAITVGPHTNILGELLVFWNGGRIRIGEWCTLGRGSHIWSQNSVSIGDHVAISYSADIHDTNGHPVDWAERRGNLGSIVSGKGCQIPSKTVSAPIVIEDDAWIGFKATILKGVHIGRGAIVAAGSVVTHDVPAWTIVAGNPARVVKRLDEDIAPLVPALR